MPTKRRQTRSAAWRGALWITLIALISTGVALTLQYIQTARTFEAQRRAVVDDEMAGLIDRYRSEGMNGVAQAIERQQAVPRIHEFFYLLALPDGTPIAGNLASWPAEITDTGFRSFETSVANTRGESSRRWVEARAVLLDGGDRLLVGDFADERATLRQRYLSGLSWSLLATGALGLLLGWWHSRRGLAFVRVVSDAGERFLSGQLAERLPVSPRGDEYDRLAETINRTFGEVERLVGSLRAATDGMAHDLKTPLTRIRTRLELADMQADAGLAQRDILEETRHDLDGILHLIDDMLSLSRAEATPASTFVSLQFDAILRELVEIYQPLAEEKGIALEAELTTALVLGSRSLLGRLGANLLDNAIKYTCAGGIIRVELAVQQGRTVLIVADNGPGIDPDYRQEVLGRFRRLDDSRTTPGSGLGLSIVDVVSHVHGATLHLLDNRPGLRVEVRFPEVRSTP
jgi:signal transduction histidine kinase